jgi:glycosyltransferase involved in cell wall biosynthesis
MKVCAIDSKECWRDASGRWCSNGGFPLQMTGIASLFDEMTLIIVQSAPKEGGMLLPENARVVPMRRPTGEDLRRKISVLCQMPYYFGTVLRECRQADVVHVPPPGDLQFLGMIAALLLKKRLLVRYCGSWHATAQTTMMNRVTRGIMRRFAGGRNVMLATGGGGEPPGRNLHWIFASALSETELAGVHPDLDRSPALPPRIVYAGRLSPEKGVDRLIQAMGRLKGESFHPLPQVTLAGDGPERGALERLAMESGCGEKVRFAGQLNRGELSEAFLKGDFCVQPSLTEGFSKAWLDAMAHGLPVVSSEVGAAREVIGANQERGWLVPPGDVPALAEALKRVICGKVEWPALRRRCRAFVTEQTLEAWSRRIGTLCAAQWGARFAGGKLS